MPCSSRAGTLSVIVATYRACSGSYRGSFSAWPHRERYACNVISEKSSFFQLSAVAANSRSSNQPSGLHVSHCFRANAIGSPTNCFAPGVEHKNHWYHHARDWDSVGSFVPPPGANGTEIPVMLDNREGNSAASAYAV